jgi:hypothetical protein
MSGLLPVTNKVQVKASLYAFVALQADLAHQRLSPELETEMLAFLEDTDAKYEELDRKPVEEHLRELIAYIDSIPE